MTAATGAAYFHHADSFAMMHGGHLDVCVLGAFQVSQTGDLANWSTGAPGAIPAVGGAMDLAIGAKQVYVMTDLLTKQGDSKLVEACTFPLTAVGSVKRVYTDHGIFEVTDRGFAVREAFGDNSVQSLRELTGLDLIDATSTETDPASVSAPSSTSDPSIPSDLPFPSTAATEGAHL